MLAREDGTIEVHHVDGQFREATLVYEVRESETVTGLNVGFVTNAAKKEILYTCFSGAVKSLVDRKAAKKFGANTEDALTNAQAKKEKDQKLAELKKQVFELEAKAEAEEKKVAPQPEKQAPLSKAKTPRQTAKAAPEAYFGQAFQADYKLNLLSAEAAFLLTVDSQLAIDSLLLHSSHAVDVLEVRDCVCKKNQIRDPSNNGLLMTLKVSAQN